MARQKAVERVATQWPGFAAMGCSASGGLASGEERVSPRSAEPQQSTRSTRSTRSSEATPKAIKPAEDPLELSPRRTVTFNDVMIYEAGDAVGTGNPEVKLVNLAVDSHADGAPQKCLELFLQTIEAAPQVLETKVANKRRRDFAFLEI